MRLDQYDRLAEDAKDRSRQYKGQIELLQQNKTSIDAQLEQQEENLEAIATLESDISQQQQAQVTDQEQLQQFKSATTSATPGNNN